MEPPTRAPFYACMYHGLCEIARKHGYALAIHGSLVRDLDLIACPWTDEAVPAEELMLALKNHINALDYRELLVRDCPWATPEQIDQMVEASKETKKPEHKPHGRKAWNLVVGHFEKQQSKLWNIVNVLAGFA